MCIYKYMCIYLYIHVHTHTHFHMHTIFIIPTRDQEENMGSYEDLLRQYYARFFPYRDFFRWLSYGDYTDGVWVYIVGRCVDVYSRTGVWVYGCSVVLHCQVHICSLFLGQGFVLSHVSLGGGKECRPCKYIFDFLKPSVIAFANLLSAQSYFRFIPNSLTFTNP